MKQKLLLKTMLLLCALIAGSSSVWADYYTITFGTGTGDGSGASTSTACSTIVSDGSSYLSGDLATAENVYYNGSSGLKLGKSSAGGTIKMNLASSITPTSIVVNAKLYNSGKSATLKVNGSATQSVSSDFSNLTFSPGSEITYIQLESSKYIWISSITVNFTAAGTPSISADDVEIVYDDTEGGIIYEIGNYDAEKFVSMVATTEADWISGFTYNRDDETGEVDFTTTTNTGVVDRSATVTLTYTYDTDKTVTKDVTVTQTPNPDLGTSTLPYTIAQAKAKIDASGTTAGKYVHGIISQIDSYSSNTITYWISDDGTTTNQFEVFRGKGKNNTDFTAVTDLELGDIVTVYGEITLYNKTTYEFSSGNYITSLERKEDSDLSITSSSTVALEITSAVPSPTSTITWTTSSKGAMSFKSNNESVVTVTSAGVITAVGAGSTTITISQAADEDYKASGNKTVTVNVTDNRSACATGIDLSSAKTILKGESNALAATSTAADGFTGSITYSYESANPDIFSISDGNYTGAGVGAATVTITATPTGGNASNYKPASQEVAVTVNGTNSISLDPTSKTVAFSASTFNIAATVPTENYNGTVTAESNNTSVATVSVEGTTVTVTPVAVGTARITVTAGTGTYYLATAQANCDVEFTAPAGSTTAPSSDIIVFEETFSKSTGGPLSTWGGSEANGTLTTDKDSWTTVSGSGAGGCAKFGTGSVSGSATTPSITVVNGNSYTLSFKAAPWSTDASKTITVTVTGGTISSESSATTSSMTAQQWNNFNFDIVANSTSMTIQFACSANRFFLDDVKVTTEGPAPTATVTLNKYGYATYCSVNPIDFSNTSGYTAWRVSSIDGEGNITFTKITEKIKGGQGVLLYNKDADGVNTSNVTINFADGTTEFTTEQNKLVGTTALTNVDTDQYYGLSNNEFVKVNAGNVPAGKALLPAGLISTPASKLTFVFEDATGIENVNRETITNNRYFNLNGQRVAQPTKGLYIVNGKKVVLK